jgi:hypothetical protein
VSEFIIDGNRGRYDLLEMFKFTDAQSKGVNVPKPINIRIVMNSECLHLHLFFKFYHMGTGDLNPHIMGLQV